MDDVDHAKKTKKLEFSSEVCTLTMRAREDWSSIALDLENIKDGKIFSKEFKVGENDLHPDIIETVFSVF